LQIFIQNVSSFALTFDYTEWVEWWDNTQYKMIMMRAMQSSLLLLMVAYVEKPKKFKYILLQSLHFNAHGTGHHKQRHNCTHPVKGAYKFLSIVISCYIYVQHHVTLPFIRCWEAKVTAQCVKMSCAITRKWLTNQTYIFTTGVL
jgi:hypothetical protein